MKVTLKTSVASNRNEVPVDSPEFVIGRDGDCNLQIQSPLVSRHHCLVTVEDEGVYVCDLGSSNGTGVNNQRLVGRRRMRDGDTLWVAATPVAVRVRREPTLSHLKEVARAITRAFRPQRR
jgi:pSer/pThr/pTyr-binding forkhead associated (FHA) protein